jgi:hypothetical protein
VRDVVRGQPASAGILLYQVPDPRHVPGVAEAEDDVSPEEERRAAPSRTVIFTQLRDFLQHDLKNVLRMEHGGNYTAALLVAVGCEALSLLLEKGPDDVLVQLLTRRGIDQHMAEDIVSALRNGLAHAFDTKFIQVGPKYVELVISWGAVEHLECETNPPRLYLNVRTMWEEDLKRVLAEVERRLADDPTWSGQVPRDWAKRWVHQANPKARPAWEERFDP